MGRVHSCESIPRRIGQYERATSPDGSAAPFSCCDIPASHSHDQSEHEHFLKSGPERGVLASRAPLHGNTAGVVNGQAGVVQPDSPGG